MEVQDVAPRGRCDQRSLHLHHIASSSNVGRVDPVLVVATKYLAEGVRTHGAGRELSTPGDATGSCGSVARVVVLGEEDVGPSRVEKDVRISDRFCRPRLTC